jgi:hypothetical protein
MCIENVYSSDWAWTGERALDPITYMTTGPGQEQFVDLFQPFLNQESVMADIKLCEICNDP